MWTPNSHSIATTLYIFLEWEKSLPLKTNCRCDDLREEKANKKVVLELQLFFLWHHTEIYSVVMCPTMEQCAQNFLYFLSLLLREMASAYCMAGSHILAQWIYCHFIGCMGEN